MYKIEVIFKGDKTERRFPLGEQFNEHVDAIKALIETEKDEISKAFIVNQEKENDNMLVYDGAVLDRIKQELGIA